MKTRKIEVEGFEMLEREVKSMGKSNTSCRIYLPIEWVGKNVVIVRID